MTLGYLYSKLFKKYIRGKSILKSKIDKSSIVNSGSQVFNSSLGRHSYVGYDCEIINCDIGAFCSIANNVVIGGANHPVSYISTSPVFFKGKAGTKRKLGNLEMPPWEKTIIGNDVWIGSKSIILQGCIIGNGAVVGAGAVVTKNVPDYAIVAGVPAKQLRYRFTQEQIKKLLNIKWWEKSDEELIDLSNNIVDINRFINCFETNV